MSIRKSRKKEDPVLKKIKELIEEAPPYWKEIVADKMKVSQDLVGKYARGVRGKRKEQHIEVLRQLKEIVKEHKERNEKLLS